MFNIDHLMKLAHAVTPKSKMFPPIEILSVIRVLREEKRLTWDEIRDWMEENARLKRSHSFWANFYKYNSNGQIHPASA